MRECRFCRHSEHVEPALWCHLFRKPATVPVHPKCDEREPGVEG